MARLIQTIDTTAVLKMQSIKLGLGEAWESEYSSHSNVNKVLFMNRSCLLISWFHQEF